MIQVAAKAAKTVGYVGAGTIEFYMIKAEIFILWK